MSAMTQTLRSTSLVANNLPVPSPLGSLEAYIGAVHRIPVLSVEEEQGLARRFRDEEDLEAARELVHSHLRFVVHVARGYSGYGLQLGDLIQEGNIGLMKAVKRFDPNMGVRLVSFAVHWIKAEIHEFILRNWRIAKIATTKAQRKLFFNLRGAKKRLDWLSNDEVSSIARELNVDPKTVRQMEGRLAAHDTSFDAQDDDDSSPPAPAEYLEDSSADPALILEQLDHGSHQGEQLLMALEALDPRSRDILERRWLNEPKATLHDLAAIHGVSAERIRQLEQNAMKRLRSAIDA